MNHPKYKIKNGELYAQRLTTQNGQLATTYHKVCMQNGFKLSKIIELKKQHNLT